MDATLFLYVQVKLDQPGSFTYQMPRCHERYGYADPNATLNSPGKKKRRKETPFYSSRDLVKSNSMAIERVTFDRSALTAESS